MSMARGRAARAAVLGLRALTRAYELRSVTNAMTNVGVVVSERLARYGFGDGHPFGPDRLAAFIREFSARGVAQRVTVLEPRTATDEELRSFHTHGGDHEGRMPPRLRADCGTAPCGA